MRLAGSSGNYRMTNTSPPKYTCQNKIIKMFTHLFIVNSERKNTPPELSKIECKNYNTKSKIINCFNISLYKHDSSYVAHQIAEFNKLSDNDNILESNEFKKMMSNSFNMGDNITYQCYKITILGKKINDMNCHPGNIFQKTSECILQNELENIKNHRTKIINHLCYNGKRKNIQQSYKPNYNELEKGIRNIEKPGQLLVDMLYTMESMINNINEEIFGTK